MCITTGDAAMTATFIHAQAFGNNCRLQYQNETQTSGKNAMILPIPGRVSEVTALKKSYVSDIYEQLDPIKSRGGLFSKEIIRVGSYIVYTTDDIEGEGADFLNTQCVRHDLLQLAWFNSNYEGWNFVIAVFSPEDGGEMHPIQIDYTSFDWMKNKAFFPLVEGHGKVPIVEVTRPHQMIMCNNLIIRFDKRTQNDDLYVDVINLPLEYPYSGNISQIANLIQCEQNPKLINV